MLEKRYKAIYSLVIVSLAKVYKAIILVIASLAIVYLVIVSLETVCKAL